MPGEDRRYAWKTNVLMTATAISGLKIGTAYKDTFGRTMNPLVKMAESGRQLLATQKFSVDGPGTILRDVEAVIDFVSKRDLSTGSRQGNLPAEVLPELNLQLAAPIEVPLKRPLLRDYPNIGGVYVLLRVMDLLQVEGKRLSINPKALAFWHGLNGTEKYFSLLEAWLFRADASVLGGSERRSMPQFSGNLMFLLSLSKSTWNTFDEDCHLYPSSGSASNWNAQLQARFGLIEVEPRPLKGRQGDARGWLMEKARRTAWGDAVGLTILASGLIGPKELQLMQEIKWLPDLPDDFGFGSLQLAFRSHFPEWKRVYGLAHSAGQPGIYVFKASFADHRAPRDVLCRLAVPGYASLHKVALAVLRAFKFSDTGHLYKFNFRDRLGKTRTYFHPASDEGPYADEAAVRDLDLPEKHIMKFLFDFGDSWKFELQLERIEPPEKHKTPIKITEVVGRPPKQYNEEE